MTSLWTIWEKLREMFEPEVKKVLQQTEGFLNNFEHEKYSFEMRVLR